LKSVDLSEAIGQILSLGKEKGYLLYDEINNLLPEGVTSPEEIDDFFLLLYQEGIMVFSTEEEFRRQKEGKSKPAKELAEKYVSLKLGVLEKTNDPVRLYLREMGSVPLLDRQGEVVIAKRIERGKIKVFKAISRTRLVIKEVIALGEQLQMREIDIRNVVKLSEDELVEEMLGEKKAEVVSLIDNLKKLEEKYTKLKLQLSALPEDSTVGVPIMRALKRYQVKMAKLVRGIEFSGGQYKRLVQMIKREIDEIERLEGEISKTY